MDALENALQIAKRKLLREYEKTCPIELSTVDAILEDYTRKYRGDRLNEADGKV